MGLGFSCIEDVNDFRPLRLQIITDQASMASPPHCFRAHNRGCTIGLGGFPQTRQTFCELRALHVICVAAKAFVPPGGIARILARPSPATQLWKVLVSACVVANALR